MKIEMNVPNILTLARIGLTPLMVLMFLLPIPYGIGIYIALGIYVIACFTDLLDGYIARKYNMITDFGKFADQIADKFLTTTAIILVLFAGITEMWISILILLVVVLRDILISGIRMVAANKNIVIAADIYGKIKSFFLDASAMILMFYVAIRVVVSNNFVEIIRGIGLAILLVGVLLSIISCVNYTLKAFKSLNQTKSADEEK